MPAGRLPKGDGKAIIFSAPSGAGKSTLIDLFPRLLTVESGKIWIDGQDLNSFSIESLRHGIAYVPQNPKLHDGTFRYNISFSNDPKYNSLALVDFIISFGLPSAIIVCSPIT